MAVVDWDTDRRYGLIYADPPWRYNQRSAHKKTKFGGGAGGHYETMSIEEIKNLPAGRLADDTCALAMWVTGSHMHHGRDVIRAWGFNHVESVLFVWVKTTNRTGKPFYGTGYYTGGNAEYVLLGRKKQPSVTKRGVSQIILEPHPRKNGKIIHSAKPECVRDHLVTLFGDIPRVELFARQTALGWDSIGDQLDTSDSDVLH